MMNWPASDSRHVQQAKNDIVSLYELLALTDERVGHIASTMDERFGVIDEQLVAIGRRFDTMDERFTAVDTRFDTIDERFTGTDRQLASLTTEVTDLRTDVREILGILRKG